MKISIDIKELREKKIFVGTPMYGGMCHGMYTKASCDLATTATKYGMDVKFFYLFNESLITRARNYLVDEFLRSPYTHLMFIDSDINFNPQDVLAVASLCNEDKPIIGAPYPKKCIAWEKIVQAVDVIQRMNSEIASVSAEQSKVIDGINESTENILQIAKKSTDSSETTVTTCQSVTDMTEQVKQMVSQFKV